MSPEALALSEHRGRRIAVTGTKGKSTTAYVTGTLLQWPVVGNSNEPIAAAVDRLGPDTDIVCELSSFQLHYLAELRPHFDAVIFTSLAVDHQDWHGSVADYHHDKIMLLDWTACRIVNPQMPQQGRDLVRFDAHVFTSPDGQELARRSDVHLLGEHNAANTALALSAALAMGVDVSQFASRLRSVQALPHRLKTVHRGRFIWVDDSIATTPESCMAAMAAISGPLGIVVGGADKGATWTALAQAITARAATVVTIGTTGPALAAALGQPEAFRGDLSRALTHVSEHLAPGATVLLSPACASFDQFTSFEDRGRQFLKLAKTLDP
jgi:UDP-N-acetylmuramoylalanine--D-glutamate ligase